MARRPMLLVSRPACETERKLKHPRKAAQPLRRPATSLRAFRATSWQEAGHYVLLLVMLLLAAPPLAFAQEPERPPTTAGEARPAETQAAPETPAAGEPREAVE